MTRRLTRTPQAVDDLAEIVAHIARDSPRAAARMADLIEAKSRLLAEHPGIGRPDRQRIGRRTFVVPPYLIAYRETPDGIEVLRYFHGRRDRREL